MDWVVVVTEVGIDILVDYFNGNVIDFFNFVQNEVLNHEIIIKPLMIEGNEMNEANMVIDEVNFASIGKKVFYHVNYFSYFHFDETEDSNLDDFVINYHVISSYFIICLSENFIIANLSFEIIVQIIPYLIEEHNLFIDKDFN